VFTGDFERRGLERDAQRESYQGASTGRDEDQYLFAGARMVWTTPALGAPALDADHRATLALSDALGTSPVLPDPSKKKGAGTFETLTGNPFARP